MEDMIEFYADDQLVTTVKSSFTPDIGTKVNIMKQTYVVIGQTFTVDYARERFAHCVCVVNLRRATLADL